MSRRKASKQAVRLRRHPRTGQLHAFPLRGCTVPKPMTEEELVEEFTNAPARVIVSASLVRDQLPDVAADNARVQLEGFTGTYLIEHWKPEFTGALLASREAEDE